jgi:flavorubredoxin
MNSNPATEIAPGTDSPVGSSARTRIAPTQIAPDTFVLHDHVGEGHAPMLVPINSMLIRGAEPVVVDTGLAELRDEFFPTLFSLVEPDDIRWVFISHDDPDHTGNLNELMRLAPNATVVVNWFMRERMSQTLEVSPLRQRWVADGEILDAGDRKLLAIRPPVYDSPTTRGLFDPTTGVYWSSDAFAAPMLTPVNDVADLDPQFWTESLTMFSQALSPWIHLADDARFQATVDRIEALGASTIAGCHTPVVRRGHVDGALGATRVAPTAPAAPLPDQAVLDQIQLAMMAAQH